MKTPFSIKLSVISIAPVFLFGIAWLLEIVNVPAPLGIAMFLAAFASLFIVFGVGWARNFPVWSVYSIIPCIAYSFLFMNMSSPALGSHDLLGFRALLPLAVTLIVAFIFNPRLKPLTSLAQVIKADKSLLLFAFCGLLPMLCLMAFDEIYSVAVIPFIIVLTALTTMGMIIYLHTSKRKRANTALISCCFFTIIIAIMGAFLMQ